MKLSQNDKPFLGALYCEVKMDLMQSLRSDALAVFDTEAVTAAPKMPRVDAKVADIPSVGAKCLRRALLEAERRYCGNKSEELTEGNTVHMTASWEPQFWIFGQ